MDSQGTTAKKRKNRGKNKAKKHSAHTPVHPLNVDPLALSPCGSSPTSPMDSLADSMKSLTITKTKQIGDMVARPGFGTMGRKVNLYANVFKLRVNANVHQYDVDIQKLAPQRGGGRGRGRGRGRGGRNGGGGRDAVVGPVKSKEEIELVYREVESRGYLWPGASFDGMKNLYIPNVKRPDIKDLVLTLTIEDKKKKFAVTVKHSATLSLMDIDEFIHGQMTEQPAAECAALDVAVRHVAAMQMQNVAIRNAIFTCNGLARDIGSGLQAWAGYTQAARPCQMGLVLNMNSCFTPMIKRQTVAEFMKSFVDSKRKCDTPMEQLHNCINEDMFVKMARKLDKLKGKTVHKPQKELHLKIFGLKKSTSNSERFRNAQGEFVNVAQHMRMNGYNVKYPNLPLVQIYKGARVDQKLAFPPECIEIKPVPHKREMSNLQKEMLIKAATMKPNVKKKYIEDCMRNQLKNKQNMEHLQAWGIQVEPSMEEIPARVLPSPALEGGDQTYIDVQGKGAWDVDGFKFKEAAAVKSWALVNFCHPDLPNGKIKGFFDALIKKMKERGMAVVDGFPYKLDQNRSAMYNSEQILRDAAESARKKFNAKCQIILVMMPDFVAKHRQEEVSTEDLYTEIKVASDHCLGIPSQCIRSTRAGLGGEATVNLNSYLANLVLKINAKLGGINSILYTIENGPYQTFNFPVLGRRPFMVIGADLTHPPPGAGAGEKQSVVGVVASMDEYLSQYACRTQFQQEGLDTGREVIKDLKPAVESLLKAYYARNRGIKPEAILFYRDGVSQGEYPKVVQHEYQAIRDACAAMGDRSADYCPPITFITVQKRHRFSFFPKDRDGADETGNILPGTCVDTHVCHPHGFDFYISSHAAIAGTSRPALYSVLVDEVGFDADSLQLLTYWMCHLFCRCTRSVSYCPPAYYAHHAAARGKLLLTNKPRNTKSAIHEDLSDSLFFV